MPYILNMVNGFIQCGCKFKIRLFTKQTKQVPCNKTTFVRRILLYCISTFFNDLKKKIYDLYLNLITQSGLKITYNLIVLTIWSAILNFILWSVVGVSALRWITRYIYNWYLIRSVWRYQRGKQNPYIEEQTTHWPKEKLQKDKQRPTCNYYENECPHSSDIGDLSLVLAILFGLFWFSCSYIQMYL